MSDLGSPWFCPRCRLWIGYKRSGCGDGHDRPRWPLTYRMADKPAYRVTRRDRVLAKVRWLARAVAG